MPKYQGLKYFGVVTVVTILSLLPTAILLVEWLRAARIGCSPPSDLLLADWSCPDSAFYALPILAVTVAILAFLLLPAADLCIRRLLNSRSTVGISILLALGRFTMVAAVLFGCLAIVADPLSTREIIRLAGASFSGVIGVEWFRRRLKRGRNLEAPLCALLVTQFVS